MPEPGADRFAILGLEPAPWIEPGALSARYRDRVQDCPQDQIEPVHQAMRILEDPGRRLAHFLELAAGRDVGEDRRAPEPLMDLFLRLGPLFQDIDAGLRRIQEAGTAIARAQRHRQAAPLLDLISSASQEISRRMEAELARLKALGDRWKDAPRSPSLVEEMTDLCRHLLYLQRWRDRLREKGFQLTPG